LQDKQFLGDFGKVETYVHKCPLWLKDIIHRTAKSPDRGFGYYELAIHALARASIWRRTWQNFASISVSVP
jgi:hypothetical protein